MENDENEREGVFFPFGFVFFSPPQILEKPTLFFFLYYGELLFYL
jgi:hypothetical protein